MPDQPSPEQLLDLLAEGPTRLKALTAGLAPEQLQTGPGPGAWSLNDILAHLRACADMWGQAIARLLDEDRPTFRAVNPRTWITQTDYPELDFRRSLRAFTRQRAALLRRLQALPPEAWSRSGTVTVAGKPLQRTVYFYAHWLATHERSHVRHVERTLKEGPRPKPGR